MKLWLQILFSKIHYLIRKPSGASIENNNDVNESLSSFPSSNSQHKYFLPSFYTYETGELANSFLKQSFSLLSPKNYISFNCGGIRI